MSVARAIELAEDLRRLDASLLDATIGVDRIEPMLEHRQQVVWALRAECAAERIAEASAEERERLAALLRASSADDGRLRASLESRRQAILVELAAASRPRPVDAHAAPRFTERVA